MENLRLIEPSILFEKEYHEIFNEWQATNEVKVPFVLDYDASDFKQFIELMEGFKKGIGIRETFVPHTTFWLVNDNNTILGVVNVRHQLNEKLLLDGGHIGYGIRPLERRKGYATKILELALIEATKLGITKALLTCNKDNIGSYKAILKNNGILDSEYLYKEKVKLRFWIITKAE